MEALPWPAITASSGGWLLFGMCMYGFITGRWFVSRREADAKEDEVMRRREENDHLREQLGVALKTLSEGNDIANAVRVAAQEKS